MTIAGLIERLEKEEGTSSELDAEIMVRIFGHATARAPNASHMVYRKHDDAGYEWRRIPEFTSSIDAALTLADQNAELAMPGNWWTIMQQAMTDAETLESLPRHVCIAALKARTHQETRHEAE